MRVIIHEEAANDLDDIFGWIEKESPEAAIELIRRIRDRIGRLSTPGLSHMGRFGLVAGTRELIEAPYIVVYQVDERRNQVLVLAIMHAKQDRR